MVSLSEVLPGTNRYITKLLNTFLLLVSITIMYVVSGCASTRSFTLVDYCSKPVNPTMARMVAYRESAFGGGAVAVRVFDNDQPVGDIGPGGRLCWDRYPGESLIYGMNKNGARYPQWHVEVDTKANTTYHLSLPISSQWKLSTGTD